MGILTNAANTLKETFVGTYIKPMKMFTEVPKAIAEGVKNDNSVWDTFKDSVDTYTDTMEDHLILGAPLKGLDCALEMIDIYKEGKENETPKEDVNKELWNSYLNGLSESFGSFLPIKLATDITNDEN